MPKPELLGGTTTPFELSQRVTHIVMPIHPPITHAPAQPHRKRVFLHVEKMRSLDDTSSYEVYFNVPAHDDPAQHPELAAGSLPMYGLRESTLVDEHHTGQGLYNHLDVTDLYTRLAAAPNWNDNALRVSFVQGNPADSKVQVAGMTLSMDWELLNVVINDSPPTVTLTLDWNPREQKGFVHIRTTYAAGVRWVMDLWNPIGWEVRDAANRIVEPDALPRPSMRAPLEKDYQTLLPQAELTYSFKAMPVGKEYRLEMPGALYSHMKAGRYGVKASWGLSLCHWVSQPGVDAPQLPAQIESPAITISLP